MDNDEPITVSIEGVSSLPKSITDIKLKLS